jgi:hypothetical protein
MRVRASVDGVEAQVVAVREQPRGRRLPGAGSSADPDDVLGQG